MLRVMRTMALLGMVAQPVFVAAENLLVDPGLELSRPDGSFCNSGHWKPAWAPGSAGAVCTRTAAHSGVVGVWQYTGPGASEYWSAPYQQLAARTGTSYSAQVWARSPAGQPWVAGSKARVRVQFRNSGQALLQQYDGAAIAAAGSGWQTLSVETQPAPPGTAFVRMALLLEKPRIAGQSIANFDDATLSPMLSVSQGALAFGDSATTLSLTLRNPAAGAMTWTLAKDGDWLSATPRGGTLLPTGSSTIRVSANRAGLAAGGHYRGTLRITSNRGGKTIPVYMDTAPTAAVPDLPSRVYLSGRTLYVARRLPNRSLAAPAPFIVKGVAWSPVSVGYLGVDATRDARRQEFFKWRTLDLAMLRHMNANTVYTFVDFGSNLSSARAVLDDLYRNGIYAIVTVDWNGSGDTANLAAIVRAYKNHPAILMWAIGNEWNINLYDNRYASLTAAAQATQAAALMIKGLDSGHPVASIFGEINITPDQPLSVTRQLIASCPAVDVWGLNIYRGRDFGNLFTQWASITAKPMFMSEFGADSFITAQTGARVIGGDDAARQRDYVQSQWRDIVPELSARDPARVCLGGTVFEWNDEWWKVRPAQGGNNAVQDAGGFPTTWNLSAQPDGFANEEYFGIVRIDRSPKPVYDALRTLYAQ